MNEITIRINTNNNTNNNNNKEEIKAEEDDEEEENLYLKESTYVFKQPSPLLMLTKPQRYLNMLLLHEQSTHRKEITKRMEEIKQNREKCVNDQLELSQNIEANMKKLAAMMYNYKVVNGVNNFKELEIRLPFARGPFILKNEIQQKLLDLGELERKIAHLDDRLNSYRNLRMCFQGNINKILDSTDAQYMARVSKSLNNSNINNIMNSYNINLGTAIINLAKSTQNLNNIDAKVNSKIMASGFVNEVEQLPDSEDLFESNFNSVFNSMMTISEQQEDSSSHHSDTAADAVVKNAKKNNTIPLLTNTL